MVDLSYFLRGQIIVECLACAYVSKKSGITTVIALKVMTAYTKHGKMSSAKRKCRKGIS